MNAQTPPSNSILKNPYLYSGVVFLVVIAYVAVLMFSRHESTIEYERRNAAKAAEQRRNADRAAVEQLGGSELAIRAFYVSPSVIERGQSAQLCYDVANAKTVTLEPPSGDVWPSHNRCLALSPKETTTYTLTIADATGKSASQSIELKVQ